MVGMVWKKGICKIIYVLWPASMDCVCKGVQMWIIMDSCLELCLLWANVYMVYGNVKGISVASGGA